MKRKNRVISGSLDSVQTTFFFYSKKKSEMFSLEQPYFNIIVFYTLLFRFLARKYHRKKLKFTKDSHKCYIDRTGPAPPSPPPVNVLLRLAFRRTGSPSSR